MNLYLCHWGDGYVEADDTEHNAGFFTADNGYDPESLAKIGALAVGEVADLSDMSGVHTVTRLA